MRLRILGLIVLLVASLPTPAVDAAVPVEASVELGPPPSWQDAAARRESGSWVKHSSPVVADLDPAAGNGPEIVVGSLDGRVYVHRVVDGQLRGVWTKDVGTYVDSSPAVGDLDGDGHLEVVVGAGNEFRPQGSGVHVFAHDGSNHRHWAAPGREGVPNHVGVFSTPALGDVDGDGRLDVVYGSFNQKLYAKRGDGSDLPGWEGGMELHDTMWSSPALADVDGDGRDEIVIGSDLGGGAPALGCDRGIRGLVGILDASARFLPGWPKCLDTPIWSSPSVVDVDGDGILDVMVGTNNYREGGVNVGEPWKVRAWTATGAERYTTSLTTGSRVFSSPAVGDVDGDGTPELAVGSIDRNVVGEVWLLDARTGAVRWHRDDGGSGDCCIFMGSPILADITGDGKAEVVAAGGDGAVHAWDAAGGRVEKVQLGRTFFNSPAAADVDGDGSMELVVASAVAGSDPSRGKIWVLGTDGRASAPWGVFKGGPARRSSHGDGRLPGSSAPQPTRVPVAARSPRRSADTDRSPAPSASQAVQPSPTASEEVAPWPSRTPLVAGPAGTDAARTRRGAMPWVAVLAFGAAVASVASQRLRTRG